MDMKGNRKIIAMVICLFIFQNSFGQSFKFPNDKNDYERYDICKVCVDYVKDYYGQTNEYYGSPKANILKLSNNKKLVIIGLLFSHNEVEIIPDITGNGILDQYGNRHDYLKKNKEVSNYKVFGVFVDGDDNIQTSIQFPRYLDIEKLPNNKILVLRKFEADFKDYVYKGVTCYSGDGDTIWEYDNDFIIWEYGLTDKNLYAAGGRIEGYYKVFNLSNGDILDERKTKTSEPTRYEKLSLQADGVHVTEVPEKSPQSNHIFPYVAIDKEYQRSLVMKKYDKNNALDQIAIADRYLKGDIFEKSEKNAFDWYMKAANQNNSQGLYKVAYCYQNGLGVGQDKAKAVEYYEKAANASNDDAINAVTKMYVNGDGIPKNMSRALYWQERLAFKNNKEAQQFVIANQSIEHERYELSPSSLREAAINNHKMNNYKWAEFCIKRAIELGDENAKLHYGLWLGSGDGVDKDYTTAEQYLTPFAESGDKDAAAVLGQMWGNLNDKKKQMYWVEKAAINGDLNSQLILANAYQNGIGVKKDKKKAFAMYKIAAESGNQDAIKEVVYSYITGKGVKKDGAEGIDWYKKLNLENQLSVAKDFEENPKIKVDIAVVIVMYQIAAEKKNYGAMKKYAEFAVKYLPEKKAIDALNLLDDADVDYTIRKSDGYMLWGQLHESYGRIGQAIECYKNSGTPKGRERAEMLNRRR